MLNRRNFLSAGAGLLLAPGLARAAQGERKKVAFIGTVVRRHSHAQHFLDRMTLGYAWQGKWQTPRVDVASVYIDQFPEDDLARGRIARHKLKQFSSIAEALTLGGSKLAVDGVVIIGEHGDYPRNDLGQRLYPRYKFFKEVVKVFEQSGRAVPVFNDKHLSTDWNECQEMVADSKRLGFPFQAGSSLPVTWRLPAIDMPYDARLRESACAAYGGIDSYDFHAYETAQCMSERRRGGEVGIRSVQALSGQRLWSLLASDDRRITRELFEAALRRSHNLPVEGGYPTDPVSLDWARKALPKTIGLFVEHCDGFRTTAYMTGIRDFNYAGYVDAPGGGEIVSCQMYLPMPGHGSTTADFFTPLIRLMETMFLTGKAPYPIERTLLTSGMVMSGVKSLARDGEVVETPEMAVAYRGPKESLFWQS
jgi:hypothetical protein